MATRLFIGNLNPQTTPEQIERFVSSSGLRVLSVRVPVDRGTGAQRGFAFVEFASHEDAERALAVFDGRELRGHNIRVKWALEREQVDRRPRPIPAEGGGFDDATPLVAPPAQPGWSRLSDDDYTNDRGRRTRRRGKHGSDRRHRVGVRRRVD